MKKDKRNNFIKIAERRTNEILKKIDSLKNFNNTSYYDCSEKDVDKIFTAIQNKVDEIKKILKQEKPKAFTLED